jgi:hypothetical protein
MSAPAPTDTKDVDRRKSLGKYVKRMSSVFKREKSASSPSTSTPAAPSTPSPLAEQKKEEEPKGKGKSAEEITKSTTAA